MLLLGRTGQVGWELHRLLEPAGTVHAPLRAALDLADADALRRAVADFRPDLIVNAAAYTAVDAAEGDVAGATALNATAPGVLAQAAAECGALLVHYSTDYVFDGRATMPYREDDPTGPLSVYGRTKLQGEEAIRRSGCRHLILRTGWVYSDRGRNFVLTLLRLARSRPDLQVVADQRGTPTLARSLAEATVRIVAGLADRPVQGLYHVTGSGEATWHAFACSIVEQGAALGLCPKVPVAPIPAAAWPAAAARPAYSVLSNARVHADFGVRLPDWESDLGKCLQGLG